MCLRQRYLFVLLLLKPALPGFCASIQGKCPEILTEKWDTFTTWDADNFTLTLSLDGDGRNCTFDREVEVEVFAVSQLEDSFDCEDLEDGDKVKKFFDGHDSPAKYFLSGKKRNLTFGFISGLFVFRIGRAHCTQIKSYAKSLDQISVINLQSQCTIDSENRASVEGRQPFWQNDICRLEISTFSLPKCYFLTNYTMASVYLVEIGSGENVNCGQMGVSGDLNPLWNTQLPSTNEHFSINRDTQIKDMVFSNLEANKNYCIFVSMWDSYPVCSRSSTAQRDLCYYFPAETFRCPPMSMDGVLSDRLE